MSEPESDPTIDAPTSDLALDAGIAVAFGVDSDPCHPTEPSLLKVLDALVPGVRQVRLRDPIRETEPPIHRPGSSEIPSRHTPNGRYQFQGEIARGGMGAVLKGHDVDLGRDVAIKVLLETHRNHSDMFHRFVEEAQIGGQLQHPGIVPLYELGQLPDNRPYFTMKLVKGQTLAKLLADRAGPEDDRPRLLKIFESACETLAYAHARGVIHRDLKPSNIMVGAFGEVQVMDWGLAKVLSDGGVADDKRLEPQTEKSVIRTIRSQGPDTPEIRGSRTHVGSVMGTPAYMPPEQAQGEVDALDERCDVFGLGAILCEILTGSPPYVAAGGSDVYAKAQRADLAECFARLDLCGADEGLLRLARQCLAAAAKDRPRNAGVVAAELARYRESAELRLHRAEIARAEAQARAIEERKRRRVQLALAGCVLLTTLLTGGGLFWAVQERAAREQEALARRAETERTAAVALGRAEQLREQAIHAEPKSLAAAEQNLALWQRALAAVEQAEAAIAAGDANRETCARVKDLRGRLEDGARRGEAALRVARLLAGLDEARLARSDPGNGEQIFNNRAASAAFQRAFAAFGLDVIHLPPEDSAAGLRPLEPGPRTAVALGLDYWAACADDGKVSRRLLAVAAAIDEDSWRQRFRKAHDRKSLESLAAEAMTRDLPAASLNLLVDALVEAGAKQTAIRTLSRASLLYPEDFWTHFRYAEQLHRMEGNERRGAIHEMLGHAWAAVAARSQCPNAYQLFACCLVRAGAHKGARVALHRAIELDPKFAQACKGLDAELRNQGEKKEEIKWTVAALQKAIAISPRSVLLHDNLSTALRELGDLKGAAAALRKSVELDPDNATAHIQLSYVLASLGDLDGALAAAQTAVDLDGQSDTARISLGCTLYNQGNLKEAMAAFQKAVELNPDNALAHGNLATALCDLNDPHGGEQEFRKAVALAPGLPVLYNMRGKSLQGHGDAKGAAAAFRKAIEIDPACVTAHLNLASVLLDVDDLRGSLAAYRKAIELDPKSAGAHRSLATVLRETGDIQGAEGELRKCIQLEPGRADDYFNLSYLLDQLHDVDGSIAAARKAIELDPALGDAYVNLGAGLGRRGDPKGAAAAFRKAVELDPESSFNQVRLADALLDCDDLAGSLAASRKALDLAPGFAEAHEQLAVVLRKLGRFSEADAAFRRAAELYSEITPSTATLSERRPPGKKPRSSRCIYRPDPLQAHYAEKAAAACRIAMAVENPAPAMLAGKEPPKDNADRALLARICSALGQNVKAARLFSEAFHTGPSLPEDIRRMLLVAAGQAALLAGCGVGSDAAGLSESDQAHWRNQALAWLQEDLALWKGCATAGKTSDRIAAKEEMDRWRNIADLHLAGRPQWTAKLSADERKAWTKLWRDVEELPRRSLSPPPRAASVAKTECIGSDWAFSYENVPEPSALLVGFNYSCITPPGKTMVVKSIQPIYLADGTTTVSKVYGRPGGEMLTVEARKGYAVAGIVGKGGILVDGFKVIFMRIGKTLLDSKDSYESQWIGGHGGGEERRLGGDGKPVVGIYGKSGDDLNALGLVQIKQRTY